MLIQSQVFHQPQQRFEKFRYLKGHKSTELTLTWLLYKVKVYDPLRDREWRAGSAEALRDIQVLTPQGSYSQTEVLSGLNHQDVCSESRLPESSRQKFQERFLMYL